MLLFTIQGALAEDIPFTQCIDVVDLDDGSFISGLTCNFTQTEGNYNLVGMTETNNQYCFRITYSSYTPQTTYYFQVNCTDGVVNGAVNGSFYVTPEGVAGGVAPVTPLAPISEDETLISEVYMFLKSNFIASLLLLLVIAFVIYTFTSRRRRKK